MGINNEGEKATGGFLGSREEGELESLWEQ